MIAHSVRDVPVDDQFINALKSRDVCYSPTFTREISTFIYDSTPPWVDDPFFLKGAGRACAEELKDPKRQEQMQQRRLEVRPAVQGGPRSREAQPQDAVGRGVRIAMGTDTGPPGRFQGFFEHLELEMMVDAGLTPMQAIVSRDRRCRASATARPARFGTLAPGAAADLLMLNANPLDEHPQHAEHRAIWINGKKAY